MSLQVTGMWGWTLTRELTEGDSCREVRKVLAESGQSREPSLADAACSTSRVRGSKPVGACKKLRDGHRRGATKEELTEVCGHACHHGNSLSCGPQPPCLAYPLLLVQLVSHLWVRSRQGGPTCLSVTVSQLHSPPPLNGLSPTSASLQIPLLATLTKTTEGRGSWKQPPSPRRAGANLLINNPAHASVMSKTGGSWTLSDIT